MKSNAHRTNDMPRVETGTKSNAILQSSTPIWLNSFFSIILDNIFFYFQLFYSFRFSVIILKNLYFTAPGIRTAMGLDRGKGTAFVLKSDITYKQWNMGSNATALDSKG